MCHAGGVRLHQLGGIPLRRALEVGGRRGAGGPAPGHGGDLGRRRAHRGASPGHGGDLGRRRAHRGASPGHGGDLGRRRAHRGASPGPGSRASASSCRANGRVCPGETAGPAGKRWRCRFRWERWNAAPWMCTNWRPWEVRDDRPGAGPPAPGNPGPQAGRGSTGPHPGRRRQPATALPRDAGPTPWASRSPPEGHATSPPGPKWLTCPSSAPWSNSTSASSPPSTSAWSRNWPTWPSSPRPATSCSWGRPAWARPTWLSPWRCGPSRTDKGPTSSGPMT